MFELSAFSAEHLFLTQSQRYFFRHMPIKFMPTEDLLVSYNNTFQLGDFLIKMNLHNIIAPLGNINTTSKKKVDSA